MLEATPLKGAVMQGHADHAMVEQAHRVQLTLEVQPESGSPYRASAITWSRAGESWAGRTIETRVSRTRSSRVHVPKDAPDVPAGEGTY